MPGLQVEGGVVAWNLDGASIRSMDPRPQQEDSPQHPPFDTPVFETMFANLQARSEESLARHGYRREGREYRIESPNRDRLAIFCHFSISRALLSET